MPSKIALALLGAGLLGAYRWFLKENEKIERSRVKAKANSDTLKDLGRLELDPLTGQYRPSRQG